MDNTTENCFDLRKEWIVIKHTIPQEITAFLDDVFYISEIRQRVGECKGISFQVRSREHNHSIPHVHAAYGEYTVSIAIEDGQVLSGNLPAKREKLASEWVITNKEKLLSCWDNYSISAMTVMTKSLINTDYDK